MAAGFGKGSTPPPLLLMPVSEGLTLDLAQGTNLLLPVPQTEPALIFPGKDTSGSSAHHLTNSPKRGPPKKGAGLNDGFFQKRWTFSDNRDFTVCIIRWVYHAELILGT